MKKAYFQKKIHLSLIKKTDAWMELLSRNQGAEIPSPKDDPEEKYKEAHIMHLAKKIYEESQETEKPISAEESKALARRVIEARYEEQKMAKQRENFETPKTKEQRAESALKKTVAGAEKGINKQNTLTEQTVEWFFMNLDEHWIIKKEIIRQNASIEAAEELLEIIEETNNYELRKSFKSPELIRADIEKKKLDLDELETAIKTENSKKIKEKYPHLFSRENLLNASIERLNVSSNESTNREEGDSRFHLAIDFMGSEKAIVFGWTTTFGKISDIFQNIKADMSTYFNKFKEAPFQSFLVALIEDTAKTRANLQGRASASEIYSQIYSPIENEIGRFLNLPEGNFFFDIIREAIAKSIASYVAGEINLYDQEKLDAVYSEHEKQRDKETQG